VELLDWVRGVDAADAVEGYGARLADTTEQLLEDGTDALEVSRAISTINDALTQRLLTLAESEFGPPPCAYAWLALGSQGRGEQSLFTDQDNALVYGPTSRDAEALGAPTEAYFAALAQRMVENLHRAGFPYCSGGYMATKWRRTLPEWQDIFHGWLDRPSSPGVVEAEVFLDFRRIHGDLRLQSLEDVLQVSPERPRFLILMARAAVTFRPPVRFGRIYSRRIDLKKGGLAPIVLLARLYALAGGSLARPTVDRLAAAAQAGQLSSEGATRLSEAYRFLTELRLRSQVRARAAGRAPTNSVALAELVATERHRLREALRVVREYQQITELHFHTQLVT
jgi:CBS domain-containing protein